MMCMKCGSLVSFPIRLLFKLYDTSVVLKIYDCVLAFTVAGRYLE